MKIVPWRRKGAMQPFMDFEDLFGRFWENGDEFPWHLPEVFRNKAHPAVNVAETEDGFHVTVDCPGLDEKDLRVEAMGNHLVVSGERKFEEEKKGKEYRLVESSYGSFTRTVPLPETVRIDPAKIDASYKKGVLSIHVPKVEKTPTARIPVHAG